MKAAGSLHTPSLSSKKRGLSPASHDSSPSKLPEKENTLPLKPLRCQPPDTDSSANRLTAEAEEVATESPYVFPITFGIYYQGKTLSECTKTDIYIIHEMCRRRSYGLHSPELTAAIENYWDSQPFPWTHPETLGWHPPTGETPWKFRGGDSYRGRPIWISAREIKKFFGLKDGYLAHDQLKPLAEAEGKGKKKRGEEILVISYLGLTEG